VKGSCFTDLTIPHGGTIGIADNPYFPFFTNSANKPVLFWDLCLSKQHICLRVNYDFQQLKDNDDLVGFQLISMEEYMINSQVYVTVGEQAVQHVSPDIPPDLFYTVPSSSFGSYSGWCSQGCYLTGFGQYELPISESSRSYKDVYTDDERQDLFDHTFFPVFDYAAHPDVTQPSGLPTTPEDFLLYCRKHKLITNWDNGVLISNLTTSLIPSRYTVVSSNNLSRNQKRPALSNNPSLSGTTLGVFFNTLDHLYMWKDDTSSGNSFGGSSLFGMQKSSVSDTTILSVDTNVSLQTLDIVIKDEWGNIIQSYAELINDTSTKRETKASIGSVLSYYAQPNQLVVPLWIPVPNDMVLLATKECIFYNENWWASVTQCATIPTPYNNPDNNGLEKHYLSKEFHPAAPRACTMIHFGRVLGHD
jgi:hypothetical protein